MYLHGKFRNYGLVRHNGIMRGQKRNNYA